LLMLGLPDGIEGQRGAMGKKLQIRGQ
jgi:hypothetical protein